MGSNVFLKGEKTGVPTTFFIEAAAVLALERLHYVPMSCPQCPADQRTMRAVEGILEGIDLLAVKGIVLEDIKTNKL